MKGLYFIAIVPPEDLASQIHEIRLAFAQKYKSEEALKPPVHLTLKEPFTMDVKEELILKRKLNFIASQHLSFEHVLKNFDRFQQHTIYISAEKHPFLKDLKTAIKKMFSTSFFHVQQDQMPFNPHYTIAYRDIAITTFEKAYSDYKGKSFNASFVCDNFILFKHNGKQWQKLETYKLTGKPTITLFDTLETTNFEEKGMIERVE